MKINEYISNVKMKSFLDIENQLLKIETLQEGHIKKHFEEIVNFKEESVHEALIKLGWTPPSKTHNNNYIQCQLFDNCEDKDCFESCRTGEWNCYRRIV